MKSIHITGNRITRREVILREMLVKEGQTTDTASLRQQLAASREQLVKTALFNSIHISDTLYADTVEIQVAVTERWYIIPTLQFALADRNFNEWWVHKNLYRVTYGGELAINNCRGRNETLLLSLIFGWRTKVGASYTIPYLNKSKTLGLKVLYTYEQGHEIGFNTRNDRLQYFRYDPSILLANTMAGAALTYRKRYFRSHTISAAYGLNRVQDTVARLNPEYLGQQSQSLQYLTLAYQFVYDKRDAITYPLRGFLLAAGIQYIYGLSRRLDIPVISLKIHRFQPLPRRFNYALGLTTAISTSPSLPYIFRNSLGYTDYVRGYEHFVVNGQAYFLLRNEIRNEIFNHKFHFSFIPIPQINTVPIRVYAKIFLDNGYVHYLYPAESNTLPNRWLNGYGLGIDIVTYYDKSLRLEYSFNGLGQRELFLHYDEAF